MRVLVCGSRHWDGIYGETRIQEVLNQVLALCEVLGQKLTIVHGGGPGADQAIDRWGRRREDDGVTVEVHPANWRTYGKAAGPIRNQAMVDRGADMCIGFLRGPAAGTRVTLALARNADIPTFPVLWEEQTE